MNLDLSGQVISRDEIEPLRQELLSQKDVGKVQKAIRTLGLRVKRDIIQVVKNYNFDSQSLGFTYENYVAWRRLATGKGTIGDVAYMVHEIAEVEELQRIRQETGFNFMNNNFATQRELRQWKNDFNHYYTLSHSNALKKEYEFVVKQIRQVTNGRVKISKLQAAAIDPTRRIRDGAEETEGALHLLVEGRPLQEHHYFKTWRQRASKVVPLSTSVQQQLGYYGSQITLEELIWYLRHMPIN